MRLALQAVVATIPDATGVSTRTAVGIPPSDVDSVSDEMRVAVSRMVILRAFDPGAAIVTGAPIPYVTLAGEPYVTLTGDPYVTVVL